jgi:hypothetical protein
MQDPANKIPTDEPVFLIRGQDVSSGAAVRAWADFNDQNGGDSKLSQLARDHATLMDQWPHKKLADLGSSKRTWSSRDLAMFIVEQLSERINEDEEWCLVPTIVETVGFVAVEIAGMTIWDDQDNNARLNDGDTPTSALEYAETQLHGIINALLSLAAVQLHGEASEKLS